MLVLQGREVVGSVPTMTERTRPPRVSVCTGRTKLIAKPRPYRGRVVKLVNTVDLKSTAARLAGSSPAVPTNPRQRTPSIMPTPIRQAALLVGGRGTRLGALTDTMPKPMAPVAGRPFLDWQIEDVARQGVTHILLLAGYKAEQIVARYAERIVRGATLEVLVEPDPLGTAGAIRLFAERWDERFYLMNGDTLFDVDLMDLPRHAGDALATLALRRTAPGGRYGTVDLAADGRVTGFLPRDPDRAGPINGGIYLVDRRITARIGAGPVSLEADVFPRLAEAGLLRGALYDGAFIDIGIPEDLERAQTQIPEMQRDK